MSEKLTKSQKKSASEVTGVFSRVHPTATYKLWNPKHGDVRVLATFSSANMLGTQNENYRSWSISKRGKVMS